MKEYLLENDERITEIKNRKYECFCGGKYVHQQKRRHERSQKHFKYKILIDQLNELNRMHKSIIAHHTEWYA